MAQAGSTARFETTKHSMAKGYAYHAILAHVITEHKIVDVEHPRLLLDFSLIHSEIGDVEPWARIIVESLYLHEVVFLVLGIEKHIGGHLRVVVCSILYVVVAKPPFKPFLHNVLH